jgi:hypothetical protein
MRDGEHQVVVSLSLTHTHSSVCVGGREGGREGGSGSGSGRESERQRVSLRPYSLSLKLPYQVVAALAELEAVGVARVVQRLRKRLIRQRPAAMRVVEVVGAGLQEDGAPTELS